MYSGSGWRPLIWRAAVATIGASATLFASACTTTPVKADTVIENIHIVDSRTGEVTFDQSLAISGSSIIAMGDAGKFPVAGKPRRIDGAGGFAVPGLWDSHAHLIEEDVDPAQSTALSLALSFGITHVRDMGSSIEARAAYLAQQETDESLPRPALLAPGPTLWAIELPYGDKRRQRVISSEADFAATLDEFSAAGVEFLKVYAGFDAIALRQLSELARQRGLSLTGHIQESAPLDEHAALGFVTVEHVDFEMFRDCGGDSAAYFDRVINSRFFASGESIPSVYAGFLASLDEAGCRAMLRRAAASGLVLTPTLMASFVTPSTLDTIDLANVPPDLKSGCDLYLSQFDGLTDAETDALRNAGLTMTRWAYEEGLPILAGTDAPTFCSIPGYALAAELALLRDSGLSPLDVLKSATYLPAKTFGQDDLFGTLEPGKAADIVILADNPLTDVAAYAAVKGVFTQGAWFDAATLEALRRPASDTSPPN